MYKWLRDHQEMPLHTNSQAAFLCLCIQQTPRWARELSVIAWIRLEDSFRFEFPVLPLPLLFQLD